MVRFKVKRMLEMVEIRPRKCKFKLDRVIRWPERLEMSFPQFLWGTDLTKKKIHSRILLDSDSFWVAAQKGGRGGGRGRGGRGGRGTGRRG